MIFFAIVLVTVNLHESIIRYTYEIHGCNTCDFKPSRKYIQKHQGSVLKAGPWPLMVYFYKLLLGWRVVSLALIPHLPISRDTHMIFMDVILVNVNLYVSLHRYTYDIHRCNTWDCKPSLMYIFKYIWNS